VTVDPRDRAYFARRAAQEVELASRATHPAAVAAHYRLSTVYLERAHPVADPPPGRATPPTRRKAPGQRRATPAPANPA